MELLWGRRASCLPPRVGGHTLGAREPVLPSLSRFRGCRHTHVKDSEVSDGGFFEMRMEGVQCQELLITASIRLYNEKENHYHTRHRLSSVQGESKLSTLPYGSLACAMPAARIPTDGGRSFRRRWPLLY